MLARLLGVRKVHGQRTPLRPRVLSLQRGTFVSLVRNSHDDLAEDEVEYRRSSRRTVLGGDRPGGR